VKNNTQQQRIIRKRYEIFIIKMIVRKQGMIVKVGMNWICEPHNKFSCEPKGKQVSWNETY